MSEQQDALEDLGAAGALAGVLWAGTSAYRRTMQDYDPDTGHGQAVVGTLAHTLFCDRLDRVFSTGKFATDSAAAMAGLDVVASGLAPGEYRKMPVIAPGTVVRSDVSGSPGWRCGDWRWLLASFTYGESNRIPWPRKSRTKQRAASQLNPDQPMLPLVDEVQDGLEAIFHALNAQLDDSDVTTLVVAHSVERELGIRELILGRSRLNKGGGAAWHWKHDLLAANPGNPGTGLLPAIPPPPSGAPSVPDAVVRLRREGRKENDR
ncbi:hypothetical protein [Streptomyces sparsus]